MPDDEAFQRLKEVVEFSYPGARVVRADPIEGDDLQAHVYMPPGYGEAQDDHLANLAAEVELDTGASILLIPLWNSR